MSRPIQFVDLAAQRARLGSAVDSAIAGVLDHGRFILGPEVKQLEAELASFVGAEECVTCSSGTDALLMAILALGVRPGDAVLVPTFTFAATAEVIALIGATPVLVDVCFDSFNLDAQGLKAAAEEARRHGLRPVGVIPVDLFGQPADYDAIGKVAADEGLWVLADAAQSLGGSLHARPAGSLAVMTTTSFFPAKPLGCYGDGGAVFTDDPGQAEMLRSIRVHGQGQNKYDTVRIGINGRLDTLQAAVLLAKLDIFPDELRARRDLAAAYDAGFGDIVTVPPVIVGAVSAWAQYTLQVDRRDHLASMLADAGVPSAIYYPKPLHRQTGYRDFPTAPGGCPVADELSRRVLSLPMHPYIDQEALERVIAAVRSAIAQGTRVD